MKFCNTYIIKSLAAILALILTINVLAPAAEAEAAELKVNELSRYSEIQINNYDELYAQARTLVLGTFRTYRSKAARTADSIRSSYDEEDNTNEIDISITPKENQLGFSKEWLNKTIVRWYLMSAFYGEPAADVVDNDKFMAYLELAIASNGLFAVGSPSLDIDSYEEVVEIKEVDPTEDPVYDTEIPKAKEDETQSLNQPSEKDTAQETAEVPTSEEAEESVSTQVPLESKITEETSADLPAESATETGVPSIVEETESTEEAGSESDQEIAAEPEADTASAPDDYFEETELQTEGGGAVSPLEARVKDKFIVTLTDEPARETEYYEKTVTSYDGTISINIAADLNRVDSVQFAKMAKAYAEKEGVSEDIVWKKADDLTFQLNVRYATDTTSKTILKIAQDELNFYKSSKTAGAKEDYVRYYSVPVHSGEDWSGLFAGYCAAVSRLSFKGMFPIGYNVRDTYYWVKFYESSSPESLHFVSENDLGFELDDYYPEKGDLVVYKDLKQDGGNGYDHIGIITGYDSKKDTIETIEERNDRVSAITGIPRYGWPDNDGLQPVCYIHPSYTQDEEINYSWPLPEEYTKITSVFHGDTGWRLSQGYIMHTGIDIYCPDDTPVMAVSDGVVILRARDVSCGNILIIDYGGIYSEFHHLNSFAEGIEKGTVVSRGDVVGYSGNTGSATTGAHLHYGLTTEYSYLWVNSGADQGQTAGYIDPLDTESIEFYFSSK